MRIEEEIKLDYSDVLFRPKRSTLKSRSEVDLKRKYKFKHSKLSWEGVPIIASNIPGNTGLLGHNYPGLYPVRNEKALSILLQKAETSPDFLSQLHQACYKLKPRFTPEREAEALAKVIGNLSSTS